MEPLPIDSLLPEIVAQVTRAGALVIEAPPGAGKTTRVPRALLDAGVGARGDIVVLEPRRLATRMAARRVAEELGEPLGRRIGYQIRFDEVASADTRVRFVTEGVLTRRLIADPELRGVSAVLLDEVHERHLATDLALALLVRLRERRRDLLLIAMSATLDAAPLAALLEAPVLRAEGRRFEVAVEHEEARAGRGQDELPLERQVAAALRRVAALDDGHILVFLPGAAEIRRAREACAEVAARAGLALHTLHGDLTPEEQDRAVRPGPRKLILSTNVAETSVTIPDVSVVIDSGLHRQATHSPWTGLPELRVAKVSRASAAQRAGRAGRTRAGRCLRLYTRHDHDARPEHDAPEIRRLDLAELVLALRVAGVRELDTVRFLEAPPAAALAAAGELLARLGAVQGGAATELGRRMAALPLHPRLARVLIEGERRGIGRQAALAVALLGERAVAQRDSSSSGPRGRARAESGPSDVLHAIDRYRARELDPGSAAAVTRVEQQLGRFVRSRGEDDDALAASLLAGFADRVARRRAPNQPAVLLSGGGAAELADSSVVRTPELMVALDAEQRGKTVVVRAASAIQADWLLDVGPDAVTSRDELVLEDGRPVRVARLCYDALVLAESRTPAPPGPEVGRLLAAAALARGLGRLDPELPAELDRLRARVAVARGAEPERAWPALDAADVEAALAELAAGAGSLGELDAAAVTAALEAHVDARALARLSPDRIELPGGRRVRVNYAADKPPWIESRLQDFFGMADGPRVAGGRTPLTLHLLAPNQRAVQVTTDLAGFWERHYPALRRELGRRYPRHAWPEDPLNASPPAPGPRRPR